MTVATLEFVLHSPDASWNYERWEQLPADGHRYEVIDGVLYMSTAPGFLHQRAIVRLVQHVATPLENQGIAISAVAPIGVLMPGCDPVQPDFLLIRSERSGIIAADGRIRGVPDLIAEVLSPNHPELDTAIKLSAYARAGVPEYWILMPESRSVLVHAQPQPESGRYTVVTRFGRNDELRSPTVAIRVRVDLLFEPEGVQRDGNG